MKDAFISLTFAIIMLNAAIQLVAIAKNVSNKTIDYANAMNDAIDCAFLGVELDKCFNSTSYKSMNFEGDLHAYYNTLKSLKQNLSKEINQTHLNHNNLNYGKE